MRRIQDRRSRLDQHRPRSRLHLHQHRLTQDKWDSGTDHQGRSRNDPPQKYHHRRMHQPRSRNPVLQLMSFSRSPLPSPADL